MASLHLTKPYLMRLFPRMTTLSPLTSLRLRTLASTPPIEAENDVDDEYDTDPGGLNRKDLGNR